MLTSPDGTTWTRKALGFSIGGALAFGNGGFLGSSLASSADGVNWTKAAALPDVPNYNGGIFLAAAYAGGKWLGVGAYEGVLTHP